MTDEDANDSRPRSSPDGSQIVFLRDKTYCWGGKAANWGGDEVVCVINADGTNLRQITPDGAPACNPRFSPDGKFIRYWSSGSLYEVDANNPAPPNELFSTPDPGAVLSPDGGHIAVSRGTYSPDFEIYVIRMSGGQRLQATDSDEGSFEPAFLSDNRTLLFVREHWPDGYSGAPKKSLWRVRLNDAKAQQLADYRLFDEPLRWKSSGK